MNSFLKSLKRLLRKHNMDHVCIAMNHPANKPCELCHSTPLSGDINGFYLRHQSGHYSVNFMTHFINPPLPSKPTSDTVTINNMEYGSIGPI